MDEKSFLGINLSFLEDRFPSNKKFPINILSWIGRHEFSILMSLFLILAGLWLTVWVTDEVVEGNTQETDIAIMMLLRDNEDPDNPIGPPWIEELMRDYTSLAGTGFLVLIVSAVTIYYLIQGLYKEMFFLLVAVLGAAFFSYLLKDIFDRPRPEFVPVGSYKYSASFPSGHALLAATTYLTLGTVLTRLVVRSRVKAYILLLATLITGLVGFTRVYLGVHYPTDVLAGWAIGVVWATFCWLIFGWIRRREQIRRAREKPTAVSVEQI
jgi:undecaprenyl-diphosphatase